MKKAGFNLSKMFRQERYQYIQKQLASEGRVVCRELAEVMQVSEDTVLRDLNKLAKERKLLKVYGGALPLQTNLNQNQIQPKPLLDNFDLKKL